MFIKAKGKQTQIKIIKKVQTMLTDEKVSLKHFLFNPWMNTKSNKRTKSLSHSSIGTNEYNTVFNRKHLTTNYH